MMRRALLLLGLTLLALALPQAAPADTTELPSLTPKGAQTIVVDARKGRDSNRGTARSPLRTIAAAWQRIPQARTLTRPVRILIRPGRYPARALPNYWESRWGSETAPIVIAAARRGTVRLGNVNLYDLRWVAFSGITFSDHNDLFHCDHCQHVLLTRSRLVGSPSELHENVKVNQSSHVGITHSTISGADDNAIDFVAVDHARVTHNVIERANDWCIYAKGGSAFVLVAHNRIRRCGTGGFTAGQGTGLQFMIAPFIRYEAYGIDVLDNLITDIEGAGIGVNGGYNIVVARNRLWNVGTRSHWLEIGYGSRSCDGQPGDDGRERCRQNLDDGGWGTTRVDDGSNYVRIPNRHVWILGNVIDNPRSQGDQLFSIAGPFSDEAQDGSGLGAVRADDDLHIAENLIAGRDLDAGVDECVASDCSELATRNELSARPGIFEAPARGDLRLRAGYREPAPTLPTPSWADAGDSRIGP
jgi:parallel beta helix pectate lyase-like protein